MDTDRMVACFMDAVRVDSESRDEARFMAWLRPGLETLGGRAGLDSGQPDHLIAATVKPGQQITPGLKNGVMRVGPSPSFPGFARSRKSLLGQGEHLHRS